MNTNNLRYISNDIYSNTEYSNRQLLHLSAVDRNFIILVFVGGFIIVVLIGVFLGLYLFFNEPIVGASIKISVKPRSSISESDNKAAPYVRVTRASLSKERRESLRKEMSMPGLFEDNNRDTVAWPTKSPLAPESPLPNIRRNSNPEPKQAIVPPIETSPPKSTPDPSPSNRKSENTFQIQLSKATLASLSPTFRNSTEKKKSQPVEESETHHEFTTTYPENDAVRYTENPFRKNGKSPKSSATSPTKSINSSPMTPVDQSTESSPKRSERKNEAMRNIAAKNMAKSRPQSGELTPKSSKTKTVKTQFVEPKDEEKPQSMSTGEEPDRSTSDVDTKNSVEMSAKKKPPPPPSSNENDDEDDGYITPVELKLKLSELYNRQSRNYRDNRTVSPTTYGAKNVRISVTELAELTGSSSVRPDNISPGGTTCSVPVDALLGRATLRKNRRKSSAIKFSLDEALAEETISTSPKVTHKKSTKRPSISPTRLSVEQATPFGGKSNIPPPPQPQAIAKPPPPPPPPPPANRGPPPIPKEYAYPMPPPGAPMKKSSQLDK